MKKKISILTSGHPYYDERIFYKFARSLHKNGHEVTIICSTVESELDIVKDNIHVYGFNGGNLKKSEKVNKFTKYLINTNPDVIICCEPLPILAAKKIRKEIKKVRIIYDVTEWYPHQNMLRNYGKIKWIINYVYLFLFNVYAASYCSHLIIGEKSKTIPYKIFLPFLKKTIIGYYPSHEFFEYSPPLYDNNTFTICYVGIINRERGIFSFLDVLKRLKSINPKLNFRAKVIGAFENEIIKHEVSEFIKANKELNVEFTGWVSYDKLSDYLRDVDLCLELREKNFVFEHSFPIKIFEFMACGKTVIYADIKSLLKFNEIDEFGFLVNPTDIDLICKKIFLYLENPSLLQKHSQAARMLFEKKYNWEKIENLLLEIVEGNS
ncbi:MAG: glycosyltransferase [Ignavibacteriaceae bacterium]|nr:glycosyltransferase [Ignavibacteriaceae bacterium]